MDTDNAQGLNAEVEVDTEAEAAVENQSFFFAEDFFHWLGCKFVTCNMTKKEPLKKQ